MGHVRRRVGDGWDGVTPTAYGNGSERHVLAGRGDGATQVELRVFRVPPGEATARERHPHEHAILVLGGRASVLLDGAEHEVGPGDHVFVGSMEEHRLTVLGDEALVFACTAPVDR